MCSAVSDSLPPAYRYDDSELNDSHSYLVPALDRLIKRYANSSDRRIFDLGCGNGSVSQHVSSQGFQVIGVDPSEEGIAYASRAYPDLKLAVGSTDDPLSEIYGRFLFLYSLEVVEHVYSPRIYARSLASLVGTGGYAVISTPYHGYLKNLALAVTGKLDRHFTALWDHGHIKFWSVKTLTLLLNEVGFSIVEVVRVGRIPVFAKSMILVARKD